MKNHLFVQEEKFATHKKMEKSITTGKIQNHQDSLLVPLTPKPFRPRIVFRLEPDVSREGNSSVPIRQANSSEKLTLLGKRSFDEFTNGLDSSKILTEPEVFARKKSKEELWKNEIPVSEIQDQVVRVLIPEGIYKVRIIPGAVIREKGQNIQSYFKSGFKDWKNMPETSEFEVYVYVNPDSLRALKFYKCSLCKRKPFHKIHNFFDHLRTHTFERPFHCKIQNCHRQFSQKCNLKKHVLRTHQVNWAHWLRMQNSDTWSSKSSMSLTPSFLED
jgi:hypothetical protein